MSMIVIEVFDSEPNRQPEIRFVRGDDLVLRQVRGRWVVDAEAR